jgi:hypothetical protein
MGTTVDSWGEGLDKSFNSFPSPGYDLPAGQWYTGIGSLMFLLGRSARWHARQAVRGFVSEDENEQLQAATSAGTAVELLAKAYLASVNPALLAERGDPDTLIHLCGRGGKVKNGPLAMKTIGAVETLRLVTRLHPQFSLFDDQPPVLRARNSAIHMALVDVKDLRVAVVQMARMVENLLVALELDRDDFWGERATQVVDSLLDEAARELERVVQAKIAVARGRLETLTADVPEAVAVAILAALSGKAGTYGDYNVPQKCPVCGQQGWLVCYVEQEEIELEDESSALLPEEVAHPYIFQCPVCHLELAADELEEFDFPSSVSVEEDPQEPDEDWGRDR